MRRAAKLAPLLFILFVMVVLGFLGYDYVRGQATGAAPPSPAETLARVCSMLAAEREAAYQAVEAGDSWGATATLAYSLRQIPGDDPAFIDDALVDEGAAATRFAVYIMAELMDDDLRRQFRDAVLDPETYPTDELLGLQYDVTHAPTLEATYGIIDRFWALANGSNPAARVASLALLAAPYSFELWPHRAYARQMLVREYPDLDITRTVLQSSLSGCKNKGANIAEAMDDVINKELTTPEEQQILHDDPACSLAIAALPSLLDAGSRANGVAQLCAAITGEADWKTRFACINQAVGFRDIGYAQEVESACEALASSEPATPDVIRARCLVLGYAREAGDIEKVRYWGEQLLAQDRIVDTIDRTLHEEVGNAIQFYADFLEKNGLKQEAASVHERLAAKFPNSVLATHCTDLATALLTK
jgi:hypothetical protein